MSCLTGVTRLPAQPVMTGLLFPGTLTFPSEQLLYHQAQSIKDKDKSKDEHGPCESCAAIARCLQHVSHLQTDFRISTAVFSVRSHKFHLQPHTNPYELSANIPYFHSRVSELVSRRLPSRLRPNCLVYFICFLINLQQIRNYGCKVSALFHVDRS